MAKNLPARPNLDHLRKQAKALLTALEKGDKDAVATFQEHLPAAKGKNAKDVQTAGYRLADAQSAIARQTGFASWPHLARHVEQLRALEGTWGFASLEVDGHTMPAGALGQSRLLIDGDRFRTESPEGVYEGIFNIDVEAEPHAIDIDFVAGPEAGNTNHGIFQFEGDTLRICLDMTGQPRPQGFRTKPGSGHAFEVLKRVSAARPDSVTGGTPPPSTEPAPADECVGFEFVPCETMRKLQGEWSAVKIVLNGQELPGMMLKTGSRSAKENEIKIAFAGQVMIHALVRVDESHNPIHVDYYNLAGASQGRIQRGIFQWHDADAHFCMAGPGQDRPKEFSSEPGSERTLSVWRPKKK